MSLFFDATWFDAQLGERGLDRAALAEAAGITRSELLSIYQNERAATAEELDAFARALRTDVLKVTLRAGIAERPGQNADTTARIESIEARLNAIDDWLAELEREQKRA